VAANVSISKLFMAGIVPGLMMGLAIAIAWYFVAKRENVTPPKKASRAEKLAALRSSLWALFLPVIVLVGLKFGVFTPTEAAVVAVAYALVLGLFVYREIRFPEVPKIFADAALTASVVMIIVGFAAMFGYALQLLQAPQKIAAMLSGVSSDPLVFLLMVNLFLLVVGMFMETFAAIIILAPILAPVALAFGIDPVHFGLIVIVNLAVGMVTPPVGVNLFVACGIARISMEQLMRPLLVFLGVLLLNLAIITYVPALSLALVR
jgi:tripartite ATP-independent transporter DctM subunit